MSEEPPHRPNVAVPVSFFLATALTVAAVIGFAVMRPPGRVGPQATAGSPKGEIAVAYPHAPLTLNPYTFEGDTIATRDLVRPVLPTLLQIGPDLRYRPSLAVRVPAGRDVVTTPFSVTYHLDPRATWSDGQPVTAGDVRFTWRSILDRRFAIADRSAYQHVTDAVVVDAHTVRLQFDGYYVWWPDLFSAGDFVLPEHDLEGRDLGAELRDGIRVGAGPFVVESWTPGLEIVYAANPRWWRPGPRFERVRVLFVPDSQRAVQLLEQGQVQVLALTTEPNLRSRLHDDPRLHVSARYGSAWWELVVQQEGPVARNPVLRQAVAGAIDRKAMVEAVVRDGGRRLESLAPGWGPGPSEAFAALGFDPEGSKRALAEAGIRSSKVVLAGPAGSELAATLQGAIRAGLEQVGVAAEVATPPEDRFYGQWLRDGRWDLAMVERRGSPMMALAGIYRSNRHPPAGVNYSRLSSAAVDEVLDAADGVKRTDPALPDVVMRRLTEALPALPLLEVEAFIAYQPTVAGPSANATVEGPFWNLQAWGPGG